MALPPTLGAGAARRGTVLVVDDDPGVLHLTSRFLGQAGLQVLTAADGLQALEIVSELPSAVDLVVSDLRMPRMDGLQLASHLQRRPPVPKMLFISGYATVTEMEDLPGAFLAKPFSQDALLREVRRLLRA